MKNSPLDVKPFDPWVGRRPFGHYGPVETSSTLKPRKEEMSHSDGIHRFPHRWGARSDRIPHPNGDNSSPRWPKVDNPHWPRTLLMSDSPIHRKCEVRWFRIRNPTRMRIMSRQISPRTTWTNPWWCPQIEWHGVDWVVSRVLGPLI